MLTHKWDVCLYHTPSSRFRDHKRRHYKNQSSENTKVKWCLLDKKSQQLCCGIFFSFGLLRGPPSSSQINHTQKLILSYECPALAWLVSWQLFLNYSIYLLTLDFYRSLSFFFFCIPFFTSFSMAFWGSWLLVSSSPCFLASPLPWFSFYLFSAFQPHLSLLLPCDWLFSSLLAIRCFRQAKNHSFI